MEVDEETNEDRRASEEVDVIVIYEDNEMPVSDVEEDNDEDDDVNGDEDVQITSPNVERITDNSCQTTPSLLPKLTDANKPPGSTTPQRPKSESDSDSEGEGQSCPICLEAWTNSGAHRIVSLNCGHLFGKSCIERWLRTGKNYKCPQCNTRAKRKDIRCIYAKKIKALDTSERDRAVKDLEDERKRRAKAEESEARAIIQVQLATVQLNRLQAQLEEERKLRQEQRQLSGSQSLEDSKGVSRISASQGLTTNKTSQGISGHYSNQTVIQVSKDGARVMALDNRNGIIVVSKPSPNQVIFPGYGIIKVSSLESRPSEYVPIHRNVIRGCSFNGTGDKMLLTGAMDKQLIITSLLSNTNVIKYTCPCPVWSCCWNTDDSNYVYCGLANGRVHVYDLRNTDSVLSYIRQEGSSCPVISLTYVQKYAEAMFSPSGLLVGTLNGGRFLEENGPNTYYTHQLEFPEGNSTCLSFEPGTRHCLLSQRPSKSFSKTSHFICRLHGKGVTCCLANNTEQPSSQQTNAACRCSIATHCTGGSKSTLLTRSMLYTNPTDKTHLMVAAGDEASSSTIIWDGMTGTEVQRLASPGGPVVDVNCWEDNGMAFLAGLTESKLSIYKWSNR